MNENGMFDDPVDDDGAIDLWISEGNPNNSDVLEAATMKRAPGADAEDDVSNDAMT